MKRTLFLLPLILLISTLALGLDLASLYYAWAESFEGDIDPNVGLTSYPSLLIPVGGRYEGIGTAATAVSGEAAFIEANPASSAAMMGAELAFHHRKWIGASVIEEIVFAEAIGPFGLGVLAKVLYSPFTAYDGFGERDAVGYFAEGVGLLNASLDIVSSPIFALSIGANAKIAFRYLTDDIALRQSSFAIPTDLGILMSGKLFDLSIDERRNAAIGVALKNFGLPGENEAPLPTTIAIGLSYSPFPALTFSSDVNVPISLNGNNDPPERISYSAGAQVRITPFFSVHTGAIIKPGNPSVAIGASIRFEKLEFVINYTVDLMRGLNPFDTISLASKISLPNDGYEAE